MDWELSSFKGDCATAGKRIYPLVLKMGLRCQGVPELTGGWLLPLFKGKGSAHDMKGYRAILLETCGKPESYQRRGGTSWCRA